MNRIFTLLVGLCLFPLLGNAQVFIDEDFSGTTGTTPPMGWTTNVLVGDTAVNQWAFDNPGGQTLNAPITDPAAIFDSDNLGNDGIAEDVALESPIFDASGVTVVTLSFDHYFQSGFGGAYEVEVNDGNGWVSVLSGGANSTANPQSEMIDVSTELAGSASAQVRFRWIGDYSWYWIVDNISVFAPQVFADDVATLSVSSSAMDGVCNGAAETVTIEVVNLGTNAASNIGAQFAVDGGTPTTPELIAGPLNPGDTLMYTFTATADLSAAGPHLIEAGATVLNDGDTSNDTADVTITTAPVIAAPYFEDFENGGNLPTGWSIGLNDMQWIVDANGTGSPNTGPSDDHSDPGIYYVYTEASSPVVQGDIGELITPCIDLSALANPRLRYWYHMHGPTMGNLYIEVIAGGMRTRIDSLLGEQTADETEPFQERILNLDAYVGQTVQVVFVGERGPGFNGDIAIDDVEFFEAPNDDVAAVAVSADDNCSNYAAVPVSITVINQ
ncbi:MAG: hypothetical protein AAFQ87_14665, partial [Bacteroidota bacterium]